MEFLTFYSLTNCANLPGDCQEDNEEICPISYQRMLCVERKLETGNGEEFTHRGLAESAA